MESTTSIRRKSRGALRSIVESGFADDVEGVGEVLEEASGIGLIVTKVSRQVCISLRMLWSE